jgi:glycosyltransferase involved in cell wall biosynthesis
MRILICNWKDRAHPRAGGAEVWTHGVARAWVEAGHDVTLACAHAPGLDTRADVDGVHIERGGDYRFGVHGHARRVYAAGRFDLVLDEINTRPFGAPRWASESRVVAFAHQVAREVWFHETPLPAAVLGRFVLEPRWLRGYRTVPVLTSSASAQASLAAYGLPHAVALPQGVDLVSQPVWPAKPAPPTFVFVGRMCSMKRPLDAVRAFATVRAAVPDARLWMIGRGPQEAALQRRIATVAGIEWLGHVSRAERDERLGCAHALLATSVREGWGLVVSEAAAVGTGTIGYAVPGLVDSIGATGGVLVRPAPEALAAAMLAVAQDPARAPVPVGTGTVPCAAVAALILEHAEAGTRV